jgi:hypothetical protein
MRENVFVPDTWCPIVGFRVLKIYLAFAAQHKQRIYQLDFVAAFLQADVLGRKFTTFPLEWKELLADHPDLHPWLGVPLRLKKSLYGDRVDGTENCANSLTKPLTADQLTSETAIYEVEVDP